jgi:chromosomal replication initiation ATPase DnaA
MKQLPLRLPRRIPYDGEHFFSHSGVTPLEMAVIESARVPRFSLLWLVGSARSGKTHLALSCARLLLSHNAYPRLIEGKDFEDFSRKELFLQKDEGPHMKKEVLLIDDIDNYLTQCAGGSSGPFVHVVESFRARGGCIIGFARCAHHMLLCDEHVMSRLNASLMMSLGHPSRGELPPLIELLARQRGIVLSEKKIHYIASRVAPTCKDIEDTLEKLDDLEEVTRQGFGFSLLGDALSTGSDSKDGKGV